MKNIAVGAAVVLGAVFAPSISRGATFLNNEKISVRSAITPSNSSLADSVTVRKVARSKSWLKIDFAYKTPEQAKGKVYNWEDGVTVEATVLAPSTYGGGASTAMFTGKVTYEAIRLDGAEHAGRFFIPPYYFERYLPAGKKIEQVIKELKVRIVFKNKSNAKIGYIFMADGKQVPAKALKSISAYFAAAEGAAESKVQKYDNTILSVDKTPWQFSKYDTFDFIKPEEGR